MFQVAAFHAISQPHFGTSIELIAETIRAISHPDNMLK
jgi:hypothetical protein